MSTLERTDRNTELLLALIKNGGSCKHIDEIDKCTDCPLEDTNVCVTPNFKDGVTRDTLRLNAAKDILIFANLKMIK